MRRMRSLVYIVWVLGFYFYSASSHATEVQSTVTLYSFQNLPTIKTDSDSLPYFTNESVTLSTQQIPAGSSIKLGALLNVENRDLSSVVILDKQQDPVANPQGTEAAVSTTLQMDYLKGDWASKLGMAFPLNSPMYSDREVSADLRRAFAFGTTWLGIDATAVERAGPLNYFVDRDLQVKARPRNSIGVESGVSWEQMYSEIWKSRLRLVTRSLSSERPRSYGFELTHVLAPHPRFFIRPQFSFYRELESQPLLNERGYFMALVSKIEVSFEPIYNLILSAGYALTVEREHDPRIFSREQVGSDQSSLSVTYKKSRSSLQLQATSLTSNRGHKTFGLQGGFEWQI